MLKQHFHHNQRGYLDSLCVYILETTVILMLEYCNNTIANFVTLYHWLKFYRVVNLWKIAELNTGLCYCVKSLFLVLCCVRNINSTATMMHHLPLSLYYTPEQLKSLYSSEHLKLIYGSEHLKSMYGQEQLKALYTHEHLKNLCNAEHSLKSLCSPEQLKSLQGSPDGLKPVPSSPLINGSPPASSSTSMFSIDNILSQSRPLLTHRPTPTYPYPYPPLPHIAPEMFGKSEIVTSSGCIYFNFFTLGKISYIKLSIFYTLSSLFPSSRRTFSLSSWIYPDISVRILLNGETSIL